MTTSAHLHDHDHHHHQHNHARERMFAWIRTALLIGLGVYFIYNIISGNLTNYINERFAWLSYVAAALFLLIGGFSALNLLRSQARDHDHEHHDHDHNHNGLSWGVIAIVAVPLVMGTLIPSRPLGAEAVDGTISLTAASAANATTFQIAPLDRNVLDWLRAFNAEPDPTAFNGEPADVIGFVYTEPTFPQDKFMVARFTISCCVADASAIAVPVQLNGEPLPQGEWVRVQGTFNAGEFRGDTMPILHADTIEVVEQPAHPYLYP